ncbi:probable trehalose-phosphate phosphatase 2 [Magnolia sinica]|uniref:probable trehalose-phosphate phosphatase 2 n=1 Tax=Magnolia sinica TaxID=86752 RepID=UPI00265923A7|nr:probable trehalose-phosphate phosphatase 2 [Magnolia sinica]
MDLKSAPLLVDPVPTNKSRLGLHSSLLSCPPPASSFPLALYLMIPWRKPITGKLDDVCANSWLDVMKSSSPRKMLIKDSNIEAVSDENDVAYPLWVLKFPSTLTSFEQIMKCAEGNSLALLMDYDGTLSPIIDDPDAAIRSSEGSASARIGRVDGMAG